MGLSPKRNLIPNRVKRGAIIRGVNASKTVYIQSNNYNSLNSHNNNSNHNNNNYNNDSQTKQLNKNREDEQKEKDEIINVDLTIIYYTFITILLIIFR